MAWSEWQTVGTKGDLLWTNNSPNNTFSPTDVELDLTNYNGILILYKFRTSEDDEYSVYIVRKDDGNFDENRYYPMYASYYERQWKFNSNGIQFYNAAYVNYQGEGTGINNTRIIPLKIIGFKKSLIV